MGTLKKDDYTTTEGVWTLSNCYLKANGSFKVDTYAQRSVRGVIRNGYLYLTAYNDEGIYKINLSNSTDVTLIPFGFTSAGKSQTGSGTCANYLFMVNDLIIGWDYQIKPDDTVVQTVGSTRLLNLGTPLFQYKEFCFGWGGNYGSDYRMCFLLTPYLASINNLSTAVVKTTDSDKVEPYAMNEVVYDRLIDLCVDICQRNGKKKLLWFGDKNKTLNYQPKDDEMLITVHRWFANKSCPGNWLYARLGDLAAKVTARLGGAEAEVIPSGMQAREFQNLTEAQVVAKVGALFTADQKKSGILASVSMAQFILESGYGKSELALGANNCFGMKKSLSGNTWGGSTWDGSSVYTKKTKEQKADGSYVTITADFRRYGCVEDSIADHSAYLLGAKNGNKLRYDGLKGCTDYKKAVQVIKDGGYTTSLAYVDKLCDLIERWKLTQYDVAGEASDVVKYYRVRKCWEDAASQLGAYTVLANAKAMADKNPGYEVYDWNGKQVYPEVAEGAASGMTNADCPFMVKVSITDLNIRKSAGTNTAKTGAYTGVGVFTIVEVKDGKGSDAGWGKLKSGAGWISLDYCQRV